MLLNSTSSSNETVVSICENCTNLIADEDIFNNETNMERVYENNNNNNNNYTLLTTRKTDTNYRLLFVIISGPLLALIVLLIAIAFLIRYFRRSHRSYSTHNKNKTGSQHRKTTKTSKDTSNTNTPAVLYTRLKPSETLSTIDSDTTNTYDNSLINDDYVQLLPKPISQTAFQENIIVEDDEESAYATVKHSNETEYFS